MPDNAIYYELAYLATAVIYGGYGLTLWSRRRALARREAQRAQAVERPTR